MRPGYKGWSVSVAASSYCIIILRCGLKFTTAAWSQVVMWGRLLVHTFPSIHKSRGTYTYMNTRCTQLYSFYKHTYEYRTQFG